MNSTSRIKFNPVTKAIEVEGTEQFVKTYFDKLQAMISGSTEGKAAIKKEPKPAKARLAKKSKKATKKAPGKKRVTNIDSVIELVQGSKEGISTAELKKKTKLSEHQIWSIVYRAAKEGKIKKLKRGAYGAA